MFRFLRNKLLVLSLLISVLPLLSVSAVGYYAARYLTDITLQNQMVESADKVRAIEQWFVERKRNATDLALVVQQIAVALDTIDEPGAGSVFSALGQLFQPGDERRDADATRDPVVSL